MKVAYFLELVPDPCSYSKFLPKLFMINVVFFHDTHVYFGEFDFGSTSTPPIDIFFIPITFLLDIIGRNSVLVTHGS